MAEAVTKLPVKTKGQESDPSASEWRPLANPRREIDRLFDDFGWGISRRPVGRTLFDVEPFWRGELSFSKAPAVDIAEKEKGIRGHGRAAGPGRVQCRGKVRRRLAHHQG